jgi:BirA family transcriptional regulator, biotin operon repressor / biotin---[acetyl-CoA-carboxylase] ligase
VPPVPTPARGPLDGDAVRAALGGTWARVDVVRETASTNADLLAAAAAGEADDRTVLIAEHQVAGRGRLERTWISPPGAGLTFSVLLRPAPPVPTWGWLPLLAGVALQSAVQEVAGVSAALKWPNDLLCGPDASKAAGILVQAGPGVAVVGIGLNVSNRPEELPPAGATSLALCAAAVTDRVQLLSAVLARFDSWYRAWSADSGDAEACGLAGAYRAVCATLGQPVLVELGDGGTVRGIATAIEAGGRLVVADVADVDTGVTGGTVVDGGAVSSRSHVRRIAAGDVHHLRPAR